MTTRLVGGLICLLVALYCTWGYLRARKRHTGQREAFGAFLSELGMTEGASVCDSCNKAVTWDKNSQWWRHERGNVLCREMTNTDLCNCGEKWVFSSINTEINGIMVPDGKYCEKCFQKYFNQ